jgi:UDP-glucose 4-epimerase
MNILITGAHGFIGRHVARECADRGHLVVGLGHGAWPEQAHRDAGLAEWRNGEVTHANLDALAAGLGVPELVIHLAGGSAVGPSFAQPAEDFRRSVLAAGDLCEWLRLRAPRARLVMASSAAVYGANHAGTITERDACNPYSPYGFHKRMAELALESYARNFGLQTAVVRFFSVYGQGLRKQLLWDCCTRLARSPAELALGGHGTELRDWLHVGDAARLLLAAGQVASVECPAINGGTGTATSIEQVAAVLCEGWGRPDLPLRFSGVARAGDPASLVADAGAALALGWVPQVAWRQGVLDYVAWFRAQGREAAL